MIIVYIYSEANMQIFKFCVIAIICFMSLGMGRHLNLGDIKTFKNLQRNPYMDQNLKLNL